MDEMDNDGDGLVDLADPGCQVALDTSEQMHDPDCANPWQAFEGPLSTLPQCGNGRDDDDDEGIDALLVRPPGVLNDSVSIRGVDVLREFINGFQMWPQIPAESPTGHYSGMATDAETRAKICQLYGWRGPHSWSRVRSTSNVQHTVTRWDEARNTFVQEVLPGTTEVVKSLICLQRADCIDGRDNDGDGLIDRADPGCVRDDDMSEAPHDEECETVEDRLEDPGEAATECSDGVNNDTDSLIDGQDPRVLDRP